ncbi:MAG: hypothetical protein FLDDKLPJ_03720 [Phycisphaerae bacterium]|nr:hypothetical protein [Phycisphaerae bacterium]
MLVHETVGQPVILTYKDYCALPNDGRRYEILEGNLHVSPAPSPFHQIIIARLLNILCGHIEGRLLGQVLPAPCDVLFADSTVVQPDLVYVAQDQRGIIGKKFIQGTPRLVVEVLSPWNADYDAQAKRQLYAKFGVPHYWMIDSEPPRIVELREPKNAAYLTERTITPPDFFDPTLFPGLSIDLTTRLVE